MRLIEKIKLAYIYKRGKRKYNKMIRKTIGPKKKGVIRGSVTSKTTQNVTVGTVPGVAGGGIVFGLLQLVRTAYTLPWPPDGDFAIATAVTAVCTAIASRAIAMWRSPDKRSA